MIIQSCDPLQKLLTKRGHLKYLYISIHKMLVMPITLIREGRSSVFSSTTYLDHGFAQVHHERCGKGTRNISFSGNPSFGFCEPHCIEGGNVSVGIQKPDSWWTKTREGYSAP